MSLGVGESAAPNERALKRHAELLEFVFVELVARIGEELARVCFDERAIPDEHSILFVGKSFGTVILPNPADRPTYWRVLNARRPSQPFTAIV